MTRARRFSLLFLPLLILLMGTACDKKAPSGTVTEQLAYIKASNPDTHDQFSYSVAMDGDTLVVGAPGESSNASGINGSQSNNNLAGSGAVYIFTKSAGVWTQQAYLKASNASTLASFGASVAISGDTVAVSANSEDSIATDSGAAYIFVRNGTTWTEQAYLKASNPDTSDAFGTSIALSGNTLAVGARSEDSDGTSQNDNSAGDSGAVYVFTRSGTT